MSNDAEYPWEADGLSVSGSLDRMEEWCRTLPTDVDGLQRMAGQLGACLVLAFESQSHGQDGGDEVAVEFADALSVRVSEVSGVLGHTLTAAYAKLISATAQVKFQETGDE